MIPRPPRSTLFPSTTLFRSQTMDVLSSMANIAGYKSVLIAANALAKFFPMLMTAAGTVLPAKVFVLGAGVARPQAGATPPRRGGPGRALPNPPPPKEQGGRPGARLVAGGPPQDPPGAAGGTE